ncbi:MAG: quaternary amine ABC transporter ATP-binding protein [Fibrobacterota bacterium]
MSKITVRNLSVIFGDKGLDTAKELLAQKVSKAEILEKTGCTVGVNNAEFDIKQGETFVLMGLSGSGKSTLLRCLNRLNTPTTGSIEIDGDDIVLSDEQHLREVRRKKIAMVFQHFGLLPHRTVVENVAFGLEIQGIDEQERRERAAGTIKTVGLAGYEEQMTSQLSGGMQQRVGLARALCTEPEVLLMDEAFSALDPLIRTDMQDELIQLQEKMNKTIVFVTHDLDEALKLGDRIAIMKDGWIVQIGTPEEILTRPADDYVSAFVENVDRSTIITARSIMWKYPERIRLDKEGPAAALRKMRKLGIDYLPVVDRGTERFHGFIRDTECKRMIDEGCEDMSTSVLSSQDVNAVRPETPVEDMLPLFVDTELPLAVIDEENRFIGEVTHSTVIAEMIGTDEKKIHRLIDAGGVKYD